MRPVPDASSTLAGTLRLWRERAAPLEPGPNDGPRRRAAGLRREELAEAAGLSVDYLVRLEQGRATAPSIPVVAALARGLRLSRDERDHLYGLAGFQPPNDRTIAHDVTPAALRLVTRLGAEVAVAVFADWRLVWWSETWAALLGDPSGIPPEQRNFAHARFPIPGNHGNLRSWPVRSVDPDATDRAVVADLRRASARYPGDADFAEFLRRTIAGNAAFADLWRAGVVGEHTEDRKTIAHPIAGDVEVDCDVLHIGDDDHKIVVLSARPDSEDARRFERARRRSATVEG